MRYGFHQLLRLGTHFYQETRCFRWVLEETHQEGYYEELLTTYTAIKIKEKSSWIHACHTKIGPHHCSPDNWEMIPPGDLRIKISRAKSPPPETDDAMTLTAFPRITNQETSFSPFFFLRLPDIKTKPKTQKLNFFKK